MNISPETPIGLIASELEPSIPYFERSKIDYTYEGGLSLREACDRIGTALEEAMESLKAIERSSSSAFHHSPHWDQKTMVEIIGHIETHHHRFARNKVHELTLILEKLPPVYGFKHPQLIFLKDLFKEMGSELMVHMSKEEEIIFPYLIKREISEAAHSSIPNPFLDHPLFRQPIRILEWEHQMAGQEWKQVHLLTDEYDPPVGTGSIYRTLYEGLKVLEEDLHRHVHLENNVLFKRALEKKWLE